MKIDPQNTAYLKHLPDPAELGPATPRRLPSLPSLPSLLSPRAPAHIFKRSARTRSQTLDNGLKTPDQVIYGRPVKRCRSDALELIEALNDCSSGIDDWQPKQVMCSITLEPASLPYTSMQSGQTLSYEAVEFMFKGSPKVQDPHTREEVERDQFIFDVTLHSYQHAADRQALSSPMAPELIHTSAGPKVLDPALG